MAVLRVDPLTATHSKAFILRVLRTLVGIQQDMQTGRGGVGSGLFLPRRGALRTSLPICQCAPGEGNLLQRAHGFVVPALPGTRSSNPPPRSPTARDPSAGSGQAPGHPQLGLKRSPGAGHPPTDWSSRISTACARSGRQRAAVPCHGPRRSTPRHDGRRR